MRNTTQTKAEEIVKEHIYVNQTELVNHLFEIYQFDYDIIENFYDAERDEYKEVFSWYACSEWLIDRLRELEYPVIDTEYGQWYGRTTFGQMISMDYEIRVIAGEIEEDNEDEFTNDQLQRLGVL